MTRTITRRQGTPDTQYDWHAVDGTLVSVRSDADGVVLIHDDREAALADAFGMGHLEEAGSARRKATTTEQQAGETGTED